MEIPSYADPAIVEFFRNHPKVIETPDLLLEYISKYYVEKPQKYKIPEHMIRRKQWSVFKKVWNEERQKFDKVVCTPRGTPPLSGFPNPSYDSDFAFYSEVKKLCDLDPQFVPAYYLLKEEGIIFLDFDQPCEKPRFRTYTEMSISGGYHVLGWYKGAKPVLEGCEEIYQDRRWIIVTGKIVDGKEDINDITEFLSEYNRRSSAPQAKPRIGCNRFKAPETVNSGGRNNFLFRYACSMRVRGSSSTAIMAATSIENQEKCNPPLSEDEVKTIVQSALRYNEGGKI